MGRQWLCALEPRDELLPAIFHHDNGWALWEDAPGIDSELGRPLNFTEMPLSDSLLIWQRSIDAAYGYGDLAGYVVSGHFSALLRHSNHWHKIGTHPHVDAAEFLERQDTFRSHALARWEARHPTANASAVAERGLKWLQFFDALSLWFCTAERVRPEHVRHAGRPRLDA